MSDLTFIVLAAGNSTRFGSPVKKQWLRIGHDPLWLYVTNRIKKAFPQWSILIVAHPEEVPFFELMCDETIIEGGEHRQDSLANALRHVQTSHVMVSDVARACIDIDLIHRLLAHIDEADVIVPVLGVSDTVCYQGETIDRDALQRIQTPQLSRTPLLQEALRTAMCEYTDESSAIVAYGGSRLMIAGDERAHKLTYLQDQNSLGCLQPPSLARLSGNGFDVHPFTLNKPMMLGGVCIHETIGFKAHSDGDVAIHALIDALLGAASMGDIGMLFPDTDPTYKDIDSTHLLERCVHLLHRFGWVIEHVDLTIIAQVPKITPHKRAMRQRLSQLLHLPLSRVNIKATTTEHLGFIGREEGVGVLASASLHYFDWTHS